MLAKNQARKGKNPSVDLFDFSEILQNEKKNYGTIAP